MYVYIINVYIYIYTHNLGAALRQLKPVMWHYFFLFFEGVGGGGGVVVGHSDSPLSPWDALTVCNSACNRSYDYRVTIVRHISKA